MEDIGAMEKYGDLAMANKLSRQTTGKVKISDTATAQNPIGSKERSNTLVN